MLKSREVSRADAVAGRIRSARGEGHLLLLLDYDGTLCDFAPDPASAVLDPACAEALRALAADAAITLGFVSGRRLDDLRRRVPLLPRAWFAGSHGLEIEGPDDRFLHDAAVVGGAAARAVAAEVAGDLARWPGVAVEDKGLSIALHVRGAARTDGALAAARFRSAAANHVAAGRLRIVEGACVTELVPAVQWTKGSAVQWIRERVETREGPSFTVFAGDDITDEDAFGAVSERGLAIAVSRRPAGADVHLDGPAAMTRVLELLRS
jgi:trehalose-phosphatase